MNDAQPRFTGESLIETVEFPATALTHPDTNEAINGQPNYETLTISVDFVDGNHADANDISSSEVHYIYQSQELSQSISQEVKIDYSASLYVQIFYGIHFRYRLLLKPSASTKRKRSSSKLFS